MSASNNSITDDGEVTIIGPSSHIKHVFEDDEEDLILQSVYHSPLDDEVWVANKSEAQALSRYDDFQTIDWCKDRVRDRLRFRQVKKKKVRGTVSDKIKGAHDAWSGWLVVFLVGIVAGFSAGCVDIGSGWLSDIKEGVCTGQFWFNRESCCWASTTKFGEESCQEWKPWSDLLGVSSHSAAYFINYILYILWALLFAGVTVVLVRALAPYASGSGIPEIKTILGGFIIHGYLGWWTYVVKTFTLVTSVATGLSLGKEGPFVHVGCCIGNVMVRLFPKYYGNEAKKREVLSAAAAAGVAVAFGAPIGGVLFSLEEVSYYFPMKTLWRTFFCALIASLTLGYMNPYGNGRLVQLYVDSSYPWQLFELAPFVFLGVLGGLYGAFFAKCNIYWCRIRKTTWLGKHPIKEVLFVTLLSSVLAYPNEFTRDQASRVMLNLFQNCGPEDGSPLCDYNYNITATQHVSTDIYPHRSAGPGVYEALWKLFLAFLFKGLITVITFGLKIPAGLFIPSMVIGACSGRIVGIGMEELVTRHRDFWLWKEFCSQSQNHCVLPGLYSMIGAAAFLGGVTRITVSLVVIMFEVTGGFTYIVPLMVGILTSKWVGDALIEGIYEGHIHLNGYPYLDPKVDFNHTTLAVDVMKPRRTDPPLTCIPKTGFTIGDLESLLSDVTFTGFPVIVDRESHFIAGFVTRRDIKVALHHARLRDETLVSASRVYFSKRLPPRAESPIPSLSLRHILDTSPITVTGGTPMEIVVDMFRKLGLRQVLITHNGRLLGIITKKDVLRHIAELSNMDPDSILFN